MDTEIKRDLPTKTREDQGTRPAQGKANLQELDRITEENLGFSALTEGLGFQSRKKPQPANKATSQPARVPQEKRSIDPKPSAPVKQRPTAATAKPMGDMFANVSLDQAAATPAKPVQRRTREQVAAETATWLTRTFAFLIDFTAILLPVSVTAFFLFQSRIELLLQTIDPLSIALYFAALLTTYFVIAESLGGQTLGKMLLNLTVVENDKYRKPISLKTAAARWVLFLFSFALLGLPLLRAVFHRDHLALHDKLSGSLVQYHSGYLE